MKAAFVSYQPQTSVSKASGQKGARSNDVATTHASTQQELLQFPQCQRVIRGSLTLVQQRKLIIGSVSSDDLVYLTA
jgi:hypothetical protein